MEVLEHLPAESASHRSPLIQNTPMIAETLYATLSTMENKTWIEEHLPVLIAQQTQLTSKMAALPLVTNLIQVGTFLAFQTHASYTSQVIKCQNKFIHHAREHDLLIGSHGPYLYLLPSLNPNFPLEEMHNQLLHALNTFPLEYVHV